MRRVNAFGALLRRGNSALSSSARSTPHVRASLTPHNVWTLAPLTTVAAQQRYASSGASLSRGDNSLLTWGALGAAVLGIGMASSHVAHCKEAGDTTSKVFTRAEVMKHDNPKDGIWVTYKDGVYDITGTHF